MRYLELVEDEDYRGEHSAPEKDGNNTLDNLSDVYPDDIYTSIGARHYGSGEDLGMDHASIAVIASSRNKPRRVVTIYRAVPHESTKDEQLAILTRDMAKFMRRGNTPSDSSLTGSAWFNDAHERKAELEAMPDTPTEKKNINPGDWVTISRAYAKQHGRDHLNNKYKITSKKVKASELATTGDSIHEWGYSP